MRKFLVLALCCLVILGSLNQVTASGIDIDELSTETLVMLTKEIGDEFVKRGVGKSAELVPGEYIAGKDIPIGRYLVTTLKDDAKNVFVTVLGSDHTERLMSSYINGGGAGVQAVLEDAMTLRVMDGTVVITIIQPVMFE